MKTKNRYYKLFADCFAVKGYSRSVICDITRKKFDFIPNSLYEIIIDEVIDIFSYHNILDDESTEIFNEYIDFLLREEYIYEILDISEKDNYPAIDLKFDYPAKISNAVIDYNGDYDLFVKSICQLELMNCNFLIVRFLIPVKIIEIENILLLINDSIIFSIDIIVDYSIDYNEECMLEMMLKYPRINIVTIFSSPTTSHNKTILNNGMGHLIFSQKEYNKDEILKIKGENNFVINIKLFTESYNYNNFFHKKVFISEIGDVKNSPFAKIIFGNIQNNSLENIINHTDFKKIWYVKKDFIEVCKDCEFRYMCVDNRNPVQKKVNEWYFEDECHYNPYINKWNFDEQNLTFPAFNTTLL
ncbi:grasp-with-spasm system SPASM domain peptide maturase [Flavobacterium pectinovorum]|uniref:grasp-with-spasm system SPASM domain peptide maturase n=1 Tax=Flavobacterium pectinovorum TaxID=29533 RepID=UPI001375A134|nr:grasp-with-spasm system SPASM domain peptide maturase [Flavobacterium pectinovorum]